MIKYKLVMFDMDGTLIRDKGIFLFAKRKGFINKLKKEFKNKKEFYQKSIEIAKFCKGFSKNEFLKIFRSIGFNPYVKEVIGEIKKKKIKSAVVTDSYSFLAEDIQNRLGIDYAFGNNLLMSEDIITGELEIKNRDCKKEYYTGKIYSMCKTCIMDKLCDELEINVNNVIAVGDGIVDIGMLKKAGLGIAINARPDIQKHADISTDDLRVILDYI